MRLFETRKTASALLAFGRRVSAGDAIEELVAARGWHLESWRPTFVESCAHQQPCTGARDEPDRPGEDPWKNTRVLRRPLGDSEPLPGPVSDAEARLMVASAADLPTLDFVEWHYIDFVLSCLGNVSEAARVLGIRRSTLQRKRKKTPPTR
jgi:hypothetical protein